MQLIRAFGTRFGNMKRDPKGVPRADPKDITKAVLEVIH